jgi:hypothetical protein
MTKLSATMIVSPSLAMDLEAAHRTVIGCSDDNLFDGDVIFSNGHRAAVQTFESQGETAWTQCVIFDDEGYELGSSAVSECFLGEFSLTIGQNDYSINVVAG